MKNAYIEVASVSVHPNQRGGIRNYINIFNLSKNLILLPVTPPDLEAGGSIDPKVDKILPLIL